MFQQQGRTFKVADNSGAKWVKCIRIIGNNKTIVIGNLLVVSVCVFINKKKKLKKKLYI